jgi:hypothetical protein
MPVVFPTYGGAGNGRPSLHAFVIAVRDFLNELVTDNQDPSGQFLFAEELLPELRAAWHEIYQEFQRIAEATHQISDAGIHEHGLYGAQLRFKLSVIRFLHRRYTDLGGRGPLRRLLGAINTLLKSILSAIGAGEGIKEIKDYIEHALEP